MNLRTNLVGRNGDATIWRNEVTPVKIVAAYVNTHNAKHPTVEFLVEALATSSNPGYADKGRLYKITERDIVLHAADPFKKF